VVSFSLGLRERRNLLDRVDESGKKVFNVLVGGESGVLRWTISVI
jgi:hypothetical protein